MASTRQDELRRLMKESKGKAQTDKRAPVATRAAVGATGSTTASAAASSIGKNQSKSKSRSASAGAGKAIPAGFFDDSLADAKARNVDVKQLAETQLNQDWEQFQEFVAEVEQQDEKDSELQNEETKEKEAVEQLENMQYVDRYRIALERAAKLGGSKKGSKRRGAAPTEEEAEESEAAVENGGDADAVANAVQLHMKKHKTTKKKQKKQTESSDADDEAFDPCNWRSKAF